ncbi:MAG: hypothetical protein ABIH41_05810 [Nanoarchaeota archaeon]
MQATIFILTIAISSLGLAVGAFIARATRREIEASGRIFDVARAGLLVAAACFVGILYPWYLLIGVLATTILVLWASRHVYEMEYALLGVLLFVSARQGEETLAIMATLAFLYCTLAAARAHAWDRTAVITLMRHAAQMPFVAIIFFLLRGLA